MTAVRAESEVVTSNNVVNNNSHFSDRQALLDALAEAGFVRLGAELRAAIDQAADEFEPRLQATASAYVRFATRDGALLELMFAGKHRQPSDAVQTVPWCRGSPRQRRHRRRRAVGRTGGRRDRPVPPGPTRRRRGQASERGVATAVKSVKSCAVGAAPRKRQRTRRKNARRSSTSTPGQPVEHHVVQQLVSRQDVLRMAVAVGPRPELLDDPRALPGR